MHSPATLQLQNHHQKKAKKQGYLFFEEREFTIDLRQVLSCRKWVFQLEKRENLYSTMADIEFLEMLWCFAESLHSIENNVCTVDGWAQMSITVSLDS